MAGVICETSKIRDQIRFSSFHDLEQEKMLSFYTFLQCFSKSPRYITKQNRQKKYKLVSPRYVEKTQKPRKLIFLACFSISRYFEKQFKKLDHSGMFIYNIFRFCFVIYRGDFEKH